MDAHDVIILEHKGTQGVVAEMCLNRPSACNALSPQMVTTITQALRDWYHRVDVVAILMRGMGQHFSAGGDLREIYGHIQRGQAGFEKDLFSEEYRLLALMHDYPKPIIAFLSGFVLGAGAALAAQATFRVADHTVSWGMPELRIGLFPDVGSRYFLRRVSEPFALYAAMSAASMCVSDVLFTGLIDYVIENASFVAVKNALLAVSWQTFGQDVLRISQGISDVLAQHQSTQTLAKGVLSEHQSTIFSAFTNIAQDDALDCLSDSGKWGLALSKTIRSYPPRARNWVWYLFREAPIADNYREALLGDYHLSRLFLSMPDLKEGIRARIIDKDNAPKWAQADQQAHLDALARWQSDCKQDVLEWVWVD